MDLLLRNPRGVIYGTVTVGALLAAEDARSETYATTVAAVLITMVVYWLADSYAELTADRLQVGTRFTLRHAATTASHELPILIGAVVPLVTVAICWLVGAALSTALIASVWATVGMLVAVELAAGVRAQLSVRELLWQTTVGAVLGLLIIALRTLLHH